MSGAILLMSKVSLRFSLNSLYMYGGGYVKKYNRHPRVGVTAYCRWPVGGALGKANEGTNGALPSIYYIPDGVQACVYAFAIVKLRLHKYYDRERSKSTSEKGSGSCWMCYMHYVFLQRRRTSRLTTEHDTLTHPSPAIVLPLATTFLRDLPIFTLQIYRPIIIFQ